MFTMEQKSIFRSSVWKVFEVFVEEPLRIHYIKEISRKINLAPTSVRKHLENLEKENILTRKKGEIFAGFVANRNNNNFLFYKRTLNIIKIKESGLINYLISSLYPKAIVLYGSYPKGEDVEDSDIDILIISKIKKNMHLEKFEKKLKRKIHIITKEKLSKLNKNLKLEIINGIIIYGYLKDE